MEKFYSAKINLSKINKDVIFEGKSGKYIDVTICIKDEADQYGYTVSVKQYVKGGKGPYIGNGKELVKKTEDKDDELTF